MPKEQPTQSLKIVFENNTRETGSYSLYSALSKSIYNWTNNFNPDLLILFISGVGLGLSVSLSLILLRLWSANKRIDSNFLVLLGSDRSRVLRQSSPASSRVVNNSLARDPRTILQQECYWFLTYIFVTESRQKSVTGTYHSSYFSPRNTRQSWLCWSDSLTESLW